jgi:enterochelin esterase-like enzyme
MPRRGRFNFLSLNRSALEAFFRHEHLEPFYSDHLRREVHAEAFLPLGRAGFSAESYPLLLLNDGQDVRALRLAETLDKMAARGEIRPFVLVAVHAGNRVQEYGVTDRPDYKQRGSLARAYGSFVREELFPRLRARYPIQAGGPSNAVAGFSLGGLSAFDLAWQHPQLFGKVGVFSGALWWRAQPSMPGAPDAHRIAHETVAEGPLRPGLRFWFQTGTHDEAEDRNGNGVIDSIDDTLDLIVALTRLGYRPFHDIQYLEVDRGIHHPNTWAKALPFFLKWAFGT